MCKLVHFSDVLKSYIPLTSYARHISWCLRHNSRNGEYKDYELFVTSAYLVSHLKSREAVCQEQFFFLNLIYQASSSYVHLFCSEYKLAIARKISLFDVLSQYMTLDTGALF